MTTLDNPGLAVQITNLIGKPIELGVKKLPASVSRRIGLTTQAALRASLRLAVATLSDDRGAKASTGAHKGLATLSGAIGGAFGLPALAIELPVSTTIIMRSIADIARSQDEDIRSVEAQLACIEVFAFGSRAESDDGAETGYYATRAALSAAVADAAKYIAERGMAEEGAPAIVRLITRIAARFSVPVSEKFAAQSIPVIGAAGGAAINLIFINHFQDMARGHFTVRRLERQYSEACVREEYERIRQWGNYT